MTTDDFWARADLAVLLCGGSPQTVRERAHARAVSPELVEHACRQALDSQIQFGGETVPFQRWEATPPGCLDVRVFDQNRYWVDALRIPHVISDRRDMTDDYLHALIDFLARRVAYLMRGYLRWESVEEHEPPQWLESTILMQELRAEKRRRTT
jgi:hypothetical protein